MAGQIILVCNQKGGVGKTNTTINLAAELRDRGNRVAMVDADPQGSLGVWADHADERGHNPPHLEHLEMDLGEALARLKSAYDMVIVDSPPRDAQILEMALRECDLAIIPTLPSQGDFDTLGDVLELVAEVEANAHLLVSRAHPNRRQDSELAAELREYRPLPVLKSTMREYQDHRAAYRERKPTTHYAPKSNAAADVRALADEVLYLI